MAFPRTLGRQRLRLQMPASMKRLRELTEHLPPFPAVTGPETPGWKEHQLDIGTSIAQNLLSTSKISVARWFNSQGSEFPYHHHTQKEWLIIISGSFTLTIRSKGEEGEEIEEERLLEWGDFVFLEPETIHKASFDEDCWYLAIAIPRSADWPTE